MKNLTDHIIDELETDGIFLHEDATDYTGNYHIRCVDADRDKVKIAISRAITKSLMEE